MISRRSNEQSDIKAKGLLPMLRRGARMCCQIAAFVGSIQFSRNAHRHRCEKGGGNATELRKKGFTELHNRNVNITC